MQAVAYSRSPLRNLIAIGFFISLATLLTAKLLAFAGVRTPDRAPGSQYFVYGMVGLVDTVLLIAIALLIWALIRQRAGRPQLVLNDAGIITDGFSGTIPWEDILAADVKRVRWAAQVVVRLTLRDDRGRYADLFRAPADRAIQTKAMGALTGAAQCNVVLTDLRVSARALYDEMNVRRVRLGLDPLASSTGY